MLGSLMDMKTLLYVAAGLAGFFIAYHTGNKLKAVLVPAGIGGVITMLPVLFDPKSFGFFGPIGLIVFVLIASISLSLGAAIGCLIGTLLRKPSESTQRTASRKWAGIGLLLIIAIAVSVQTIRGNRMKGLEAVAERSGATFLQQHKEVLSKTGPITQVSVSSKGHNQDGYPSINFFVDGKQGDADVRVDVSGTKEAPVFLIRSVEPRPTYH